MAYQRLDFLVAQDDLRTCEWRLAPTEELQDGQVRLRIDRFALTANNITYAVFGKKMRYWDFFPAPLGFGRVPVWGFAEVVESAVEDIPVGERVYGLLPISSELVVTVGQFRPSSFVDSSPWRSGLPATYNRYALVRRDPQFSPESEDYTAVFLPLFKTSYLICDFFEEEQFFDASSILISSASSKTSLALGFLLSQSARPQLKTIGLTSARNRQFVQDTGYFNDVCLYTDIKTLPLESTVYADMAGSGTLRAEVHGHFDGHLRHSCAVGGSHWENPGRASGLAGPKPTLFFAPGRAGKRSEDWGIGELERRMAASWRQFVASAEPWAKVAHVEGATAVRTLYQEVLEGRFPPDLVSTASVHD